QLNHHNIGVLTYPESEEEADFYANSAKAIWQGIPGVIAWLKKNAVLSLF
ncbi:MAG: hypothetical protein HOM80_01450, partial [Bacteroidetes bacterium]|nr:hypothetical protein [Bacteroidota bacterium]